MLPIAGYCDFFGGPPRYGCAGPVRDNEAARRTALIAAVKLVVRNLGWLVGGTLFVEVIFNLDGFGHAVLFAVNLPDPALAEAVLLTATIAAVGLALVVDLVAAAFVREWRTT